MGLSRLGKSMFKVLVAKEFFLATLAKSQIP
jgi:hypothetical protein